MSNQFYDYLTNKLLIYFEKNAVKRGDKFFISFDEDDQVQDFSDSLERIGKSKLLYSDFPYAHEKSTKEYKTFAIEISDIKIVVSDSLHMKNSFSNTLRNRVIKQEGDWEDTALLFICTEAIDSIEGGAKDLQKEGMPLNVKSISDNLESEIDKSRDLNKTDKQILKFSLNIIEEEDYQTTLWDYKPILAVINKGYVDDEDFIKFNLFKDDQLHNYSPAKMDKRLKENYDTYSDVSEYSQYEEKKEKLEKMFIPRGVEVLSKKNWYTNKWKNVKYYKDEYIKRKKPLRYIENPVKVSENDLVYWERPTGTGKRNKNIIVFNPDSSSEITLKFTFNKELEEDFIDENSKEFCEIDEDSLIVNFNVDQNNPTFKLIKYTHNNQNNSAFKFNIVVVNFTPEMIDSIEAKYTVDAVNEKIEVTMEEDIYTIELGFESSEKNEIIINEDGQDVYLYEGESIFISEDSPVWFNEDFNFKLYYYDAYIPFLIKESGGPLPKRSHVIWNQKRKSKDNFKFNGVTAVQGVQNYSLYPKFKEFLEMEKEIIEKDIFYAERKIDSSLKKVDIAISENLKDAYLDILDYYKTKENLPSFVYLNDNLKEKYEYFLNIFNEEISSIEESTALSVLEDKKDLLKLGCVRTENKIMFSPLSPLNISYQLEIAKQCKNENLPDNILKRLVPNNLVPYICFCDEKELYRPIYQEDAHEWLIYKKSEEVSIGTTNEFISNVVTEKLDQFVKHFTYLFSFNYSSQIKINLINIKDDKEVVKGVFNFIKSRLLDKSKTKNVIPVEINIYEGGEKSYFDTLFDCKSDTELDDEFGIKLPRNKNIGPMEIIRRVQNNIYYYKHLSRNSEYEYAHVSFYKVISHSRVSKLEMNKIETGLSLDGLLSSVSSTKESGYRLGFGTKNISNERIADEDNLLISTVIKLNELISNSKNYGMDPYSKNESLTTTVDLDEGSLKELYEKSHWVTFIEPTFDIKYFDSFKNKLIIIHYSDQYTSSSKYDTITVTNKSPQYKEIIKEFLFSKNAKLSDDGEDIDDEELDKKLENVIKIFNSINGEWLLRIISNSGQYDREKLSIISAIKYCLALFDHEDIVWIPVSMEEHIRIAKNIKLDRNKGIFDPKLIKGAHSDDLLFIGIKFNEYNRVEVIVYPIEVKIGLNDSSTINKGKVQLEKTYKHLRTQLEKADKEDIEFRNKFFRNFFIQLLLSNERKFVDNQIWDEKGLDRIEKFKDKLLNDEYDIIYGLEKYIGIGAVVSFKTEAHEGKYDMEDKKIIIELPEEFAYDDLAKPMEEIYNKIQNYGTDIRPEKLLSHVDISDISVDNNVPYEYNDDESEDYGDYDDLSEEESDDYIANDDGEFDGDLGEEESDDYIANDGREFDGDLGEEGEPETPEGKDDESIDLNSNTENESTEKDEDSSSDISNIRALIGTQKGHSHKVYWEFGHPSLANRHMLIQGKSGQGKTYFIQRMLKELSLQGIPSIIIDYTDGFKKSKLEKEFKESLGDRIEQHLVYSNKFPLNPFKRNLIELDDEFFPENDVSIASRFKSVVNSVYNFGDQQLNTIYNAVLRGLSKYGEEMDLSNLKKELIKEDSSFANSVLNRLSELLDINPFESNKYDWSNILDNNDGKVLIIQLTGLSEDIQRIISEFILWDLWYYKKNTGSKDKPFIMVLDEAHNLDFSEKSPCSSILVQGRNFGWSGWFATQSVKGNMKPDEISKFDNADEKIYFHPTDVSSIAKELSHDNEDRKIYEKELSQLTNGYCIVQGTAITPEGKLYYQNPLTVKVDTITVGNPKNNS